MHMRWLIVGIVFLIAGVLFVTYSRADPAAEICFENTCALAEVVDTPDTRAQGLMFREALAENEGMFFIFDRVDNYPFWMKNTLIPLDIIWLNESYTIVHIAQAEPCLKDPCVLYDPHADALYALEMDKGFAEANGISVGDIASVRYK